MCLEHRQQVIIAPSGNGHPGGQTGRILGNLQITHSHFPLISSPLDQVARLVVVQLKVSSPFFHRNFWIRFFKDMATEGSACSQDSYPRRSPCLRQRTENKQDLCSFLLRAELGFLMRCYKYKTPFTGPGVNPHDMWMYVHALLCLCGVISIFKEKIFDN